MGRPEPRTLAALAAALAGALALGAAPAAAAAPPLGSESASEDPLETARFALRNRQYGPAVLALQREAARGASDAQYLLGLTTLAGLGTTPDRDRGLEWLRGAALQGHPAAAWALAGELRQDAAESRRWIDRAAAGG
jgi:TPR repeat protein